MYRIVAMLFVLIMAASTLAVPVDPDAPDGIAAWYGANTILCTNGEPPRDCRRLHSLRGWGYGKTKQILSRGPGEGGSDGHRACERA